MHNVQISGHRKLVNLGARADNTLESLQLCQRDIAESAFAVLGAVDDIPDLQLSAMLLLGLIGDGELGALTDGVMHPLCDPHLWVPLVGLDPRGLIFGGQVAHPLFDKALAQS